MYSIVVPIQSCRDLVIMVHRVDDSGLTIMNYGPSCRF